ncbi:MAG: hypothetical protein COB08_004985 [Rhodobacteraceae bacterium]|nr:hypothetical protein [Paracoccaceae bacterium]
MVDFKKQLSNVAFGGAWSEALVAEDELQSIMDVLRRAANNCADRDVNDKEFLAALRYVREEVEKGPMLVEGLQKALLEPHPALRQKNVQRYVDMVEQWVGV